MQDVTLHIQLERNGHHQEWKEKYTELFYALGFKKIESNEIDSSELCLCFVCCHEIHEQFALSF